MKTEDIWALYSKSSDAQQDMHIAFSACIDSRARLGLVDSIYFINDTLRESPCFVISEGVCGAMESVFKKEN
jgi:hypothetical protein